MSHDTLDDLMRRSRQRDFDPNDPQLGANSAPPRSTAPPRSPAVRDADLEQLIEQLQERCEAVGLQVQLIDMTDATGLLDKSLRTLLTEGLVRAAKAVQKIGTPGVSFSNAVNQDTFDGTVIAGAAAAGARMRVVVTSRDVEAPTHVLLLGETPSGGIANHSRQIGITGGDVAVEIELGPLEAGDHRFLLLGTRQSPGSSEALLESELEEIASLGLVAATEVRLQIG